MRFVRLVLGLMLASLAAWAAPVVGDGGVLNAASFTLRGLPGHGIAQGSTFVVFGTGLGPGQLVVVSSFPLPIDLAGTSIQVRSGGQILDCTMVFTSALQLAAILPSNTPVGLAELRVTYNQETSDWVVIEVARPGQYVILWGGGLGAIRASDAEQPPVANLPADVVVKVGGKVAELRYKGRSGCCAGIDEVHFIVPVGVSGCYVPVVVIVDGIPSNYTSISVAEEGSACSDPNGIDAAALEGLGSEEDFQFGILSLGRSVVTVPGSPDQMLDAVSGLFRAYNSRHFLAVIRFKMAGVSARASCLPPVSTRRGRTLTRYRGVLWTPARS